ncbi:hypothetical protein SAFG77S_12243 [Streptomyces afghaniensis]
MWSRTQGDIHRIRTKFLDDLLQQASASGVRQVVLLGAGMDSRPSGWTGPTRAGREHRPAVRVSSRVVALDGQLHPVLVEVVPVHDQAEALVCLQAFRVGRLRAPLHAGLPGRHELR